jgi:hypothetical protein
MIPRAADGYYHPANEEEIVELVQHARAEGLKIRVRGAAHSVEAAIYTGDFLAPPPSEPGINIYMDRMIAVSFDDEKQQVTVEAGCHLGYDPADPAGTSTVENSLFYQLDQHGWAFPDTGGIIHQTVGGFLSTGSSGGSIHHGVGRQIVTFRLVDGQGQIRDFHKSDDLDDPFYGLGVSLGLMGIFTSVTFQCMDRYDIEGVEITSHYDQCEIDLFGPGDDERPSLEQFFRQVEHSRLMWFPQKGIEKMIVWKARKLKETPPGFQRVPYEEFPKLLGSTRNTQVVLNKAFKYFDNLNEPKPSGLGGRLLRRTIGPFYRLFVNKFLIFAVLDPQKFQDSWWQGLPMDNNVDYDLINVRFTELWIPLERSMEVMQDLRTHFEDGGFKATGTFTCEVYATPSSDFWLSPSYGQDVIKVDPFWLTMNRGNPDEVYFPALWEKLKKYDYRLHWGKSLSGEVDFLKPLYPRWDDWMQLRAELDPDQIFVTDYWRRHLGIA